MSVNRYVWVWAVLYVFQAVFDINSDNDAEVSLQVANALTLALLNYRAKMIPLLVCCLHYYVFYVCLHCWVIVQPVTSIDVCYSCTPEIWDHP